MLGRECWSRESELWDHRPEDIIKSWENDLLSANGFIIVFLSVFSVCLSFPGLSVSFP